MRFLGKTTIFSLLLVAGVVALALSLSKGVTSVSASNAQNGQIHITKDCSSYTGLAGGYCTIVTSNFAGIPATSTIYYDQAFGIPNAAWLDSNVVLDAGDGNKAVGRCTLDSTTLNAIPGVCTFSDGTGQLAGFTARVDVTFLSGALYAFDGTYSFSALPPR